MPREIAFYGFYFPTVTVLFITALLLTWGVDRILAGTGLYRWAWHPTLLRLAIYVGISCALTLPVYR